MLHRLKLTNFVVNESNVSMEFDWNGVPQSHIWNSVEDFYAQNADMIQGADMAALVLACYMLLMGDTHETLPGKAGWELKLEVDRAVMQAITLTPPPPA